MQIYGWLILGISAIAGGLLLFTDKPMKLKLLKAVKGLFLKDPDKPEEHKTEENLTGLEQAKPQLEATELKVRDIEKKMERLAQRNDVEGLKVLSRERGRLLTEIDSYKANQRVDDAEYVKQLLAKYSNSSFH